MQSRAVHTGDILVSEALQGGRVIWRGVAGNYTGAGGHYITGWVGTGYSEHVRVEGPA